MCLAIFTNDIYPIALIVGTINDIEELNKNFKDLSGKDIAFPNTSAAITTVVQRIDSNNRSVCVIFKDSKPAIRIIVHESFHAVCKTMKLIDTVEINFYTKECYAYLIGWIAEKICEYFK